MTKKKTTTYSLGIVLLALAVGVLIGVISAPKVDSGYWQKSADESMMSARMNSLMELVDSYYVDKVDYDSVSNLMMNAMLSTLDPHSAYLTPEAFAQETEMMQGQFHGVGITLFYLDDTVYASRIIPGSPAAHAGIQPGDRIIYVDTTQVSGTDMTKTPSAVVDRIRGPRYSTVTLGIQRGGTNKIRNFKVKRDVIHYNSIPAVVMMDKTTGYILVSRFAETTATEFHSALLELGQQGMKHLVLDLRGNSGGLLDGAINMADELLPKGDLIVYTQGAHHSRKNYYATRGGLFEEGRLTVLIDEHSASASEVVSGAIQDNDRGAIIGHRSFGKGLVQHQFNLPGNAAVLLTIARYYSPSGRCIQRPYDKGSDEYYMAYLNRVLSDYNAADSVLNAPDTSSEVFLTKQGRKVYGGGGIQPDVALPYFRDISLVYYNNLISKQAYEQVLYAELNARYEEIIQRFPTLEVFEKEYRVDDATFEAILRQGDKKGLTRDPKTLDKYGAEMRNRYRALMAMSLYGDAAYYKVALPFDTEIQQAVRTKVKLTAD